MNAKTRKVSLSPIGGDLRAAVRRSLEGAGILDRVAAGTRVALKPNFTYPYYKRGVTTSPQVIREVVLALRERTDRVALVETDGGYGAWQVAEAFKGHGMYELQKELGVEVVNLCEEPREPLRYRSRGMDLELPLPTRLLHDTDVFITMPVPKIHCMTGLTLSYKNQWGVVPDIMRLRRHYVFDDAIVAINRALRPAVLADGQFFLDRNGPMEGDPVAMGLIIGASDAGAFDRYVSQLMGWSWRDVPHLRRAVALGDMPEDLQELSFDVHPDAARTRSFRLERTPRNWIALAGFKSRFLTWFGYESWIGRGPLHTLLYAIAGKPVKPKPEEPAAEIRA
jgi:uncharacterized protein (DUF362 family)